MRRIIKGNEPNSRTPHSKQRHSNYDNYADKDDLRVSTHTEQRGICCYCLGYIAPITGYMKIEHFKSQAEYPDFQLKYHNILGACMGNERQPKKVQHCDTFKGDGELSFNPADRRRSIQNMIWYSSDGTIGSENHSLSEELNSGLNLNIPKLINNRAAALTAFQAGLSKFKGQLKIETIRKMINDWNGDSHNDDLQPYCQVVVFWLQKKLNRLRA